MAHGANNTGWWRGGESKFYINGDDKFPTIYETREEDCSCGSYGYEMRTDEISRDV